MMKPLKGNKNVEVLFSSGKGVSSFFFLCVYFLNKEDFRFVVCVPKVTKFERTVSCKEKNEKMEQKHNHTVVGRVKERVVVVVVVKSEYTQAKSLSCSKCECSKILILRHV